MDLPKIPNALKYFAQSIPLKHRNFIVPLKYTESVILCPKNSNDLIYAPFSSDKTPCPLVDSK
jgi:hypothetical protein